MNKIYQVKSALNVLIFAKSPFILPVYKYNKIVNNFLSLFCANVFKTKSLLFNQCWFLVAHSKTLAA